MTKKLLLIALYRALDVLYDEMKDGKHDDTNIRGLEDYLAEANPYLFVGRESADPAISAELNKFFDQFYSEDNITPEESYQFIRKYLSSEYTDYYGDLLSLFDDISLDEWVALCQLIEKEQAGTE